MADESQNFTVTNEQIDQTVKFQLSKEQWKNVFDVSDASFEHMLAQGGRSPLLAFQQSVNAHLALENKLPETGQWNERTIEKFKEVFKQYTAEHGVQVQAANDKWNSAGISNEQRDIMLRQIEEIKDPERKSQIKNYIASQSSSPRSKNIAIIHGFEEAYNIAHEVGFQARYGGGEPIYKDGFDHLVSASPMSVFTEINPKTLTAINDIIAKSHPQPEPVKPRQSEVTVAPLAQPKPATTTPFVPVSTTETKPAAKVEAARVMRHIPDDRIREIQKAILDKHPDLADKMGAVDGYLGDNTNKTLQLAGFDTSGLKFDPSGIATKESIDKVLGQKDILAELNKKTPETVALGVRGVSGLTLKSEGERTSGIVNDLSTDVLAIASRLKTEAPESMEKDKATMEMEGKLMQQLGAKPEELARLKAAVSALAGHGQDGKESKGAGYTYDSPPVVRPEGTRNINS